MSALFPCSEDACHDLPDQGNHHSRVRRSELGNADCEDVTKPRCSARDAGSDTIVPNWRGDNGDECGRTDERHPKDPLRGRRDPDGSCPGPLQPPMRRRRETGLASLRPGTKGRPDARRQRGPRLGVSQEVGAGHIAASRPGVGGWRGGVPTWGAGSTPEGAWEGDRRQSVPSMSPDREDADGQAVPLVWSRLALIRAGA
jgi:hypothetical protein